MSAVRLSLPESDQISVALLRRGLQDWGGIEPDGPPTDIEFIRSTLHEIRRPTGDNQGSA